MAPEMSFRVMVTNVTRWNSALTDNDIEMDSDNCNLSFEFTQILSDAETAKSQYTSFESEMTHLWTIFSMIGDSSMSEATNTNYAISPLMGTDRDEKSGALGYGITLATSIFVAMAF